MAERESRGVLGRYLSLREEVSMPSCNQCHKPCKDYHELATHIVSSKGHKKGRRWATKYLAIHGLSPKNRRDLPKHVADNPDKESTEFGEENRQNRFRELSGREKGVITMCPKCHTKDKERLPTEFTESPVAWRIDGILAKLCERCS